MRTFESEPRYRWEFRLVEMMVVVTLITIVVLIVYPVYARAQAKARESVCMTNLEQLSRALYVYLTDHDDTYPRARPKTDDDTWVNYDGDDQISALELLLYETKRPEEYSNPRKFGQNLRCPADPQARYSRESSYSTNGWFEFGVRDSEVHHPTESIYLAERRRGMLSDFYIWWLFQPNQWPPNPWDVPEGAAASELDVRRHRGFAYYLYTDGHGKLERFEDTWKPYCQHWTTRL